MVVLIGQPVGVHGIHQQRTFVTSSFATSGLLRTASRPSGRVTKVCIMALRRCREAHVR